MPLLNHVYCEKAAITRDLSSTRTVNSYHALLNVGALRRSYYLTEFSGFFCL